ncbi:MAG: hypothetical protein COT81_05705 [Candidatus Buchananbacteria bacterium CG10_big_fil_rev_8_21_14_0_10_42_9]|uniref:Uncharacterized protein n=1 Tax=Candidatus Buchananbacteria bacterium CG10_big_fil_rev_8_21_14_0_10_42_9 TaxID=1974526 RepID=A0A2H0VZP1_9BACT|nr:MAG: hypothetical protein COT81_05705 [Candidatus Buchananbacteria bacterium CG10_big_fil_rev_8_21_14_0_10_42_9]
MAFIDDKISSREAHGAKKFIVGLVLGLVIGIIAGSILMYAYMLANFERGETQLIKLTKEKRSTILLNWDNNLWRRSGNTLYLRNDETCQITTGPILSTIDPGLIAENTPRVYNGIKATDTILRNQNNDPTIRIVNLTLDDESNYFFTMTAPNNFEVCSQSLNGVLALFDYIQE